MLCHQINEIGPEISLQKWQKVWTQLKTKIKRKASSVATSQARTGGGPPTETPLTDIEEKVVFIISREGVYGLQGPDGVSLESGEPCVDISMPSTSSDIPKSWVAITEESEAVGMDIESVFSTDASTTGEPSADELPTPMEAPKRSKKPSKVSDALESVMEQTDHINTQIANLTNEMYEVRGVLNNLLEEHRHTNSILERIARALEDKK